MLKAQELFIFDRSCDCVFHRKWATPTISNNITNNKSTGGTNTPLLKLQRASISQTFSTASDVEKASSAMDQLAIQQPSPLQQQKRASQSSLTPYNAAGQTVTLIQDPSEWSETAKLVYGMLYSLKNVVNKLSTRPNDRLLSLKTSSYKLFVYTMPSGMKLALFTDASYNSSGVGNQSLEVRDLLNQLYLKVFVEYAVKNPLCDSQSFQRTLESNPVFALKLDEFIRLNFSSK